MLLVAPVLNVLPSVTGKSVEFVVPATYMSSAESTAIDGNRSVPAPPR
jgi:hypothetical protein